MIKLDNVILLIINEFLIGLKFDQRGLTQRFPYLSGWDIIQSERDFFARTFRFVVFNEADFLRLRKRVKRSIAASYILPLVLFF